MNKCINLLSIYNPHSPSAYPLFPNVWDTVVVPWINNFELDFNLIKPFVMRAPGRATPNIIDHWGCRSLAVGTIFHGDNSVLFSTYGSPPDGVIKRLAAITHTNLKLEYYNRHEDFCGRIMINVSHRKWKDNHYSCEDGDWPEDVFDVMDNLSQIFDEDETIVERYDPLIGDGEE